MSDGLEEGRTIGQEWERTGTPQYVLMISIAPLCDERLAHWWLASSLPPGAYIVMCVLLALMFCPLP